MLLELCAVREVEFVWLPVGNGIGEYQWCDQLAREIIAEQVRRIIEGRAEPGVSAERGHEVGFEHSVRKGPGR
jgi:hypothetical protein